MYLHIINKSKINSFVDKNIDKKTCNDGKKDYLCCKKKGKEDLLFFERNFYYLPSTTSLYWTRFNKEENVHDNNNI